MVERNLSPCVTLLSEKVCFYIFIFIIIQNPDKNLFYYKNKKIMYNFYIIKIRFNYTFNTTSFTIVQFSLIFSIEQIMSLIFSPDANWVNYPKKNSC